VAVDPEDFFDATQGAAVLKHGILKRYLAVFASKVGSTAPDGRVFYLDAYAGPGEYDDGGEGSPAVALATADFLSRNRRLVGIYVEKNKKNRAKLEAFLAKSPKHENVIIAGGIQENFAQVLEIVGDAPLLAFFDPFGLTVPMDQLKALMERKRRNATPFQPHATTELIINVSYVGIGRVTGVFASEKGEDNPKFAKMRETVIARCNEKFGGEWWQSIALERPDDWIEKIAHGYAKRLHDTMGVGWFRFPVRDAPGGPVAYELLLISRYTREAHWHFHEQVSLANGDWRTLNKDYPNQQDLPFHEADEDQWITAIKVNIVELLKNGDFKVRDKWNEVYGTATITLARGTHVRSAIKELFKEGVTLCDGKKQGTVDLPDLIVTRGPNAPALNPPPF
jgi:three-Cys-motif partner protein